MICYGGFYSESSAFVVYWAFQVGIPAVYATSMLVRAWYLSVIGCTLWSPDGDRQTQPCGHARAVGLNGGYWALYTAVVFLVCRALFAGSVDSRMWLGEATGHCYVFSARVVVYAIWAALGVPCYPCVRLAHDIRVLVPSLVLVTTSIVVIFVPTPLWLVVLYLVVVVLVSCFHFAAILANTKCARGKCGRCLSKPTAASSSNSGVPTSTAPPPSYSCMLRFNVPAATSVAVSVHAERVALLTRGSGRTREAEGVATGEKSALDLSVQSLRTWNKVAAAVHLICGVACVAILGTAPGLRADALSMPSLDLLVGVDNSTRLAVSVQTFGTWEVSPLVPVVVFFFLTAAFHMAQAHLVSADMVVNWCRWVEYALTSSLLLGTIFFLSYLNSAFLLVSVVASNGTMNLLGGVYEYLFHLESSGTGHGAARGADRGPGASLSVFCIASSIGLVPWGVLWFWYADLIGTTDDVPWFVPCILVVYQVLFFVFPCILLRFTVFYKSVTGTSLASAGHTQRVRMEKSFIVASLVAKVSLAAIIATGVYGPSTGM